MQGKGIVKFFLVVITLVCLVQYLFIIPTNQVENAADEYAAQVAANVPEEERRAVERTARTEFLDSMSTEEILEIPLLKSYTYQELKAQQLALGLDLKGGMSVVLQVDLRGLIEALAENTQNPTFQAALQRADEAQKEAQTDYVTLFLDAWQEVADGEKLAPIFIKSFPDDINFNTSDGEVARLLRTSADETVDLTFNLLKERIDKLGVAQPNVSLDDARDLIIVELPGIDNPERARSFLQATAELEFWDVYRITDSGIQNAFTEANQRLARQARLANPDSDQREILSIDTLYNADSTSFELDTVYNDALTAQQGPLFEKLTLNTNGQFPFAVLGTAERNQRDQIDTLLASEEVQSLFPRDIRFLWSRSPVKDFDTGEETTTYELYGIKIPRNNEAPLSGELVTDASQQLDQTSNQVAVSLDFNNTGAKIWGQMTTKAAQDGNREIAIVLDEEVVSAPRVNEPITTGNSQITGGFTIQEARDLANILQIGKLPAETQIIQESLVGPSLGQENINRSVNALVIGFLIVLVFMIIYYGGAGIVSIVALFLNLFFIFGALASIGTVLTLPGIAGIVLTIGMAVDANVIIFERVREELREGKSLLMAIRDGFQNSYSAIVDANVTTIIVAIILAYFGLGPIKGFAVVLIVGVLSSLFTAVLVGRLIIDWWTADRGKNMSFFSRISENAFANLNIDWIGKRRLAYIISSTIIVLGIAAMFVRGFELGVDFKGGYSYNVQFEQGIEVDAQELRTTLTESFDGSTPVVKVVDSENTFNIVTDYLVDDNSSGAADQVMRQLFSGVNQVVGGDLQLENFRNSDGEGTYVTSSSKVGPTIADDIQKSAFYAATFALLAIFLYIFLRFSKWQYSAGAVAALFHDVLVVLGIFAIFHGILPFTMEIDQAFIAAILTVIGYSINDTVVVFDRIREFTNQYLKRSKEEVINMAINSTVSRTVITSLTTFFVVAILFVFGGTSIKGFAFALLVGIIVGTYSSIFVATPVMSDLTAELKPKDTKDKKSSFSRATSKVR